MTEPRHPGGSAAMRKALDAIGCGDNSPSMAKKTRDALLRQGLIVRLADKMEPLAHGRGLMIHIAQFEMTIPTHMAWCEYWAAQPLEEEVDDER